MGRIIEDRLLPDRITIRKPVQTMVPATKRPVFEFQVIASGVHARFNPDNTAMEKDVLGQVPKKRYQLFLNVAELLENYEIVNEKTGEVFRVLEVLNLFDHHLEVSIEEKK
jgi:hypothetical protein